MDMCRPRKTKESLRKSGYNTYFSTQAAYYLPKILRLLCYLTSIWNTRGWSDGHWRAVWEDLLWFWMLSHSLLWMSALMSPRAQQRPTKLFWMLQSFSSTGFINCLSIYPSILWAFSYFNRGQKGLRNEGKEMLQSTVSSWQAFFL